MKKTVHLIDLTIAKNWCLTYIHLPKIQKYLI